MKMSGPSVISTGPSPTVIFECGPSSYTFEQRTVILALNGTPTKIGRSQGPLKPKSDNAIFECRVLSRNHAQIWYQDGSFYLKDTGSSNGTFVNGKKINDNEKQGLIFSMLFLMLVIYHYFVIFIIILYRFIRSSFIFFGFFCLLFSVCSLSIFLSFLFLFT